MQFTDQPAVAEVRDVIDLVDPDPVIDPGRLRTGLWIASHYLAPPFAALALFLPAGLGRPVVTTIRSLVRDVPPDLDPIAKRLLRSLLKHGPSSVQRVRSLVRGEAIDDVVERLLRRGLIERAQAVARAPARPKVERWVALGSSDPPALTDRRRQLFDRVAHSGQVRLAELRQIDPGATTIVRALEKQGALQVIERQVRRDPLAGRPIAVETAPVLSSDQARAWQAIRPSLQPDSPSKTFLLFGVTGSGKTEIYLRSLEEVVRQGRRGIILVPEIALTEQAIERFAARLPGRAAILHSRLSPGEHFDEWQRITRGEVDVVVGSRSALFAPVPDVGLIVLDEEHDWAYKQADQAPRYHSREVALRLSRELSATVILGSATPDVTTFQAALDGRLELAELPERVSGGPLPEVEVVDLRAELKSGNRSVFSRSLHLALGETLARGEQAILYLNRRGSASVVICRDCGYTARCRRCDTVLTFHAERQDLVCHTCNLRQPSPTTCPNCGSGRIRFLGAGTQRIVEEVERNFPTARVLRLDSDIKGRNDTPLSRFGRGEADILVGTQVVAKGLDLPGVSLVGVVNADVGLFLPDFRAGERVFQLLTQVAGRPGRRGGGRTIVQTYAPDHYVIRAAARHDFLAFFDEEIAHRRTHRYPPFSRIARLLYRHRQDARAQSEAERLGHQLAARRAATGLPIDLFGPAPAYFRRVRGLYRWQILVRGEDPVEFLDSLTLPPGWIVDVDPYSML